MATLNLALDTRRVKQDDTFHLALGLLEIIAEWRINYKIICVAPIASRSLSSSFTVFAYVFQLEITEDTLSIISSTFFMFMPPPSD